jgi:MFS family permease
VSAPPLSSDARRVLAAQALRAFGYGFGAVLLGATLDERGFTSTQVGLVLTAVVAGTALASLAVGRWGDRIGRRRSYVGLYLALAVVGVVFSTSSPLWALMLVALSGALSTEVVESGPFTSLEQSMLASELVGHQRVRGFGIYNAVATASGALGALAAGLPDAVHRTWTDAPANERWFLLFVPVALAGAAVAASLSADVEAEPVEPTSDRPRGSAQLGRSKPTIVRLAGLFAMDSFGGGFVVQAFIAYWLATRFGASIGLLGVVFFAVGMLQTLSFLSAPLLARRFGLLNTMVFSHLPSNVLLAVMAFAPTLEVAIALLLARVALSQMDVPTRQAYVMALVEPDERTAAAAYTNTARYVVRPLGPTLAGAVQTFGLGVPFLLAGGIKATYDLILWRWFRTVPLPDEDAQPTAATGGPVDVLEDSP